MYTNYIPLVLVTSVRWWRRRSWQVTDGTLLSNAEQRAHITGSRIGATIALKLPVATGVRTCGELAEMEPAAGSRSGQD